MPRRICLPTAGFLLLAGFLAAVALSACRPSVPGPGNVIVLCAGDSLTEGGYPRYLRRLLEKGGVRARVLNYGRSGNTSGEYLSFLERAGRRLAAEKPDFILLQLGTNDVRIDGDRTGAAEFERNMRRIIKMFKGFRSRRGRAPRIFLALVPPVPPGVAYPFADESSVRVEAEINPLLLRLAGELGLDLVDNFTLFTEEPKLLPDVHPTPEGYRRLAVSWHAALKPHLPR
ncbi:MAG: SGNH/GDSL hydrolase family protein [Candidatus Aminicenantes bacterium]|nr:SGNH/GDSL hydrolase family protein [Candidatus Aminicenantes bacterium]